MFSLSYVVNLSYNNFIVIYFCHNEACSKAECNSGSMRGSHVHVMRHAGSELMQASDQI